MLANSICCFAFTQNTLQSVHIIKVVHSGFELPRIRNTFCEGVGGMQYTSVCNPLSPAGEFLSNENLCKANLLSVLLASQLYTLK
jgi:hypothetical protein